MLAMLEADAQCQLVSAQRQIKGAEYFQIVVIADRAGYEPFERATGIGSDNVERAACGVASEQRALRPAQHPHPLDIDTVHQVAARPGNTTAAHADGDRRIALRLVPDIDLELGSAREGKERVSTV